MANAIPPNTTVEWLDSQKGKSLLIIYGHLFTNSGNGKNPAVRYWKCVGFETNN